MTQVSAWITIDDPEKIATSYHNDTNKARINLLKAHAKAYRLYQKSYKMTQKGNFYLHYVNEDNIQSAQNGLPCKYCNSPSYCCIKA